MKGPVETESGIRDRVLVLFSPVWRWCWIEVQVNDQQADAREFRSKPQPRPQFLSNHHQQQSHQSRHKHFFGITLHDW